MGNHGGICEEPWAWSGPFQEGKNLCACLTGSRAGAVGLPKPSETRLISLQVQMLNTELQGLCSLDWVLVLLRVDQFLLYLQASILE